MDVHARIAMLKEEVDILSKIIESDGYMIPGSKGEMRIHPGVRERHAAVALIARLERGMPVEVDDELNLE